MLRARTHTRLRPTRGAARALELVGVPQRGHARSERERALAGAATRRVLADGALGPRRSLGARRDRVAPRRMLAAQRAPGARPAERVLAPRRDAERIDPRRREPAALRPAR